MHNCHLKALLTLSTNVKNQDPYPTTVSNRILAHLPLTIGHAKTTSRAYTLPTPSTNSVYGNGIVPLPFTTPIVTLAMTTSSTILNSSMHSAISNNTLMMNTGLTFGDSTSPSNWEPIAQARQQ
jgi:hypothetical protein